MRRILGRSGVEVSAIGMGCWAIGGPQVREGKAVGWGGVEDGESVAALRLAYELGCTFFDTADVYGGGHSERLIARALADVREKIVICSKVGYTFVEGTGTALSSSAAPQYIMRACEDSLRRLGTSYLDLYLFHLGGHDLRESAEAIRAMEEIVRQGKARHIGWSTDDPGRAGLIAESPAAAAIELAFNLLGGNGQTLAVCEERGLAAVVRNPLEKGLLSGKFNADSRLAADDIRAGRWNLRDGEQGRLLGKIEAVRSLLTSGGRSMAQGALCWLLGRSPLMIPIPGFKNRGQVKENLGAMDFGPLPAGVMEEIQAVMAGG